MQPLTDVIQREPTLISPTHYCVVGDVAIDASAAIAPGVVLQAASGSRIIIGSGVCIAAGVCIQSRSGILTISNGVSLGANVLVIGNGTIGAKACVSPGSTVINPTVTAEAILPPASLIGADLSAKPASSDFTGSNFTGSSFTDSSFTSANSTASAAASPRPQHLNTTSFAQPDSQSTPFKNTFVEPGPVTAKPITTPDLSDQSSTFVPPPPINQPFNTANSNGNSNPTNGVQSGNGSSSLTVPSNNFVYGKSQVTQLISALFPNRQSLNGNSSS